MNKQILAAGLLMLLPLSLSAEETAPAWRWQKNPVPLGLVINGLWYESFHVDAAMDKAGTRLRTQFKNLSQYNVLVLVNVSVNRIPKGGMEEIREFVNQGGGLVILGGLGAYDNGGYGGTPLEEMLPVALKDSWIDHYATAENGAKLTNGEQADWPLRLDFAAGPVAYYFHTLTPKAGAKVQVKVGQQPALVSGTYGKGRVVACALTVNGNPAAGMTPFWEWKDWPALLGQAIEWAEGTRPIGTIPEAAVKSAPAKTPPPALPQDFAGLTKAMADNKTELAAIDGLGLLGNLDALPALKSRYEASLKPARLPDGPDRWEPLVFADASPLAAHVAVALYRLGDPEGVARLSDLYRVITFHQQILWMNSYRSTPARLRAQTLDVAWEFIEANVAPIPAAQAAAFVKYAATANDPVEVEFLASVMEKSAGQLPKADWNALLSAKSGIIVKMSKALTTK